MQSNNPITKAIGSSLNPINKLKETKPFRMFNYSPNGFAFRFIISFTVILTIILIIFATF